MAEKRALNIKFLDFALNGIEVTYKQAVRGLFTAGTSIISPYIFDWRE
ncbi:MAG: hypothetical protein WKF97_06690 [Chitinophagaceae bacterium]